MNNPVKTLTKKEWSIWLVSIIIVLISNLATKDFDLLTLVAALTGVTSLIFAAKGNVCGQVLMILFSILYGIISFRFRYWGEMMTYLGMTLPMAVWSTITWIENPSENNGNELQIQINNDSLREKLESEKLKTQRLLEELRPYSFGAHLQSLQSCEDTS